MTNKYRRDYSPGPFVAVRVFPTGFADEPWAIDLIDAGGEYSEICWT